MNRGRGWDPWRSPALDPTWLEQRLATRSSNSSGREVGMREIEILHARAREDRMTLLYRMAILTPRGRIARVLYTGYLVPPRRFLRAHEEIRQFARIEPPGGRTVIPVAEADLILLAYPNDRRLRLPTELELKRRFEGLLEGRKGARGDGRRWAIRRIGVEVIRYVPERRWTARCVARMVAAGGRRGSRAWIVKQWDTPRAARRLYRNLRLLEGAWGARPSGTGDAHASSGVSVPRALALVPERALIVTDDLKGRSLKHALSAGELEARMASVGELLGRFHRGRAGGAKKLSILAERDENRRAADEILAAAPGARSRLSRILEDLERCPWRDRAVLLHGSFRLNHILLRRGGLSLIDLDSLRVGPPAYDLGNLLSSFLASEADGKISPSRRARATRRFLAGYAATAPAPVSPGDVLWFVAALLLQKQAIKYASRPRADRERKLRRMLALAETAAARCRASGAEERAWDILP